MPVNEFNEMKDLEVMTFRRNILCVCKDVVEDREKGGAHARALYVYPPNIESTGEVPPHLKEKLNSNYQSRSTLPKRNSIKFL